MEFHTILNVVICTLLGASIGYVLFLIERRFRRKPKVSSTVSYRKLEQFALVCAKCGSARVELHALITLEDDSEPLLDLSGHCRHCGNSGLMAEYVEGAPTTSAAIH